VTGCPVARLCQMAAVRARMRWPTRAVTPSMLAAVQFQVELAFEGVVDRLDELADRLEQVLAGAGAAVAVGRAQQLHAAVGEEGVEFGGDVALVGDDDQPGPTGGQGRVLLQDRHQDLPVVQFRVGQRPADR